VTPKLRRLFTMGPSVRERELGARLRQLRIGLDLTVEAVAGELLCSATKISRIETGARRASLRDVRDLCGIYGVSMQEIDDLMRLASQAREPSWWTHYEDLRLSPYIGLEQDAVAITVFSMYWVPALLQTEDYARAMITGIARKIEPPVLQQRIEARLRRQDLLNRDKPPRYRALLDEAVLHRKVGGSSVMAEQLGRILQLAQEEKVTVQVIPFEAGAHAGADSNFEFLEFRDPAFRNIVFVEGLYSNQYQEKEAELERYREAIEYLRDESMGPKDSLTLIADIRKTYAT
jgi:transcriptional regulator with XRE-family HTH domain